MLLPLLMQLEMLGPKIGTGGVDKAQKSIYKPTGLLHGRKTLTLPKLTRPETLSETQPVLDDINLASQTQTGIPNPVAEYVGTDELKALAEKNAAIGMTQMQMIDEIKLLIAKQMRTDEEEALLLIFMEAI